MSVDDRAPPKAPKDTVETRLSKLVAGRSVKRILRADELELAIEFDDGTRIFARALNGKLELSVT